MFEISIPIALVIMANVLLLLHSLRLQKSIGEALLKGLNGYGLLPLRFANSVSIMYAIVQMNGYFKYAIFLFLFWIDIYLQSSRLTETGLKINIRFYPRSKLIGYQMVEGSTDEADIFIAKKNAPIRLTFRKTCTDANEILERYFR